MTPKELEALLYDWECGLTLERQTFDAPFFNAILRNYLPGFGDIAVLGCGTGRVAIPLAGLGWQVTGIDLSAERLARARRRTVGATWPVWQQGDMRQNIGLRPQDAIIVPYSTFLLLRTAADRQACFGSIRGYLKPSGLVILDVSPNFLGRAEQRRVPTLSAAAPELGAWVDYFESVRQCPEAEVTFIGRRYVVQREHEQLTFARVERWWSLSPERLSQLSTGASMKVVRSFADYHGAPLFSEGVLVADAAKHIHVMTPVQSVL